VAEIILIHGIGAPTDGAATEMQQTWLTAVAAGSPPATYSRLVERSAMAYYRDWSWAARLNGQGPGTLDLDTLDPDIVAYLDELATAWLTASQSVSDPTVARTARREVMRLTGIDQGEPQGPTRVARTALAGISKVPLFANAGFGIVQRTNLMNLWQVAAYVNNVDDSKEQVLERVGRCITPDTRVILAHSLGTVVAYEAIHRFEIPLDLLVTTGSPLGLDSLIYPRLQPEAAFAAKVKRWVNVADPDDFVAADPRLADRFPDADGRQLIEDLEVHNKGRYAWHSIAAYLSHDNVRSVIWSALDA
jgi:hypothetical protein